MKKYIGLIILLVAFLATPVFAAETSFPNGFPNGVSVEGISILNSNVGKVFWVGNGTTGVSGSNGNKGTKSRPFATIDYAIGRTTANRGDIILVQPNHREVFTGATSIDFDVVGVAVVGIGEGSNAPFIVYSGALADLDVEADNVTIDNFNFEAGVSRVVVGINIRAGVDYTTISNSRFIVEDEGTDEFLSVIKTNDASNYATISGNWIDMIAGGQAINAISMVDDTKGTVIVDNTIFGDYSTANINGTATASVRLVIGNNLLVNGEGDDIRTEPCIELLTASTGVIQDNYCVSNLATKIASISCDGCMLFENYYNEDVATGTGGIIGAASADD